MRLKILIVSDVALFWVNRELYTGFFDRKLVNVILLGDPLSSKLVALSELDNVLLPKPIQETFGEMSLDFEVEWPFHLFELSHLLFLHFTYCYHSVTVPSLFATPV
jgi:hypothetical protein